MSAWVKCPVCCSNQPLLWRGGDVRIQAHQIPQDELERVRGILSVRADGHCPASGKNKDELNRDYEIGKGGRVLSPSERGVLTACGTCAGYCPDEGGQNDCARHQVFDHVAGTYVFARGPSVVQNATGRCPYWAPRQEAEETSDETT